ncbi:MAG: ABC transporter ATP-binding protein [Anaerolineae bacterium]
MLEVDIEKRLDDFTLRVSFRVGLEVLVLFGPSGAGKSMTISCIAGLAHPDRGLIRLDGRVLFESDGRRRRQIPVHKRRIGYVFQSYALFPHMTVSQNLAYGIRGQRDAPARVQAMLTRLHLEGLADRYPHQLSGGQQQRVALGRALMIEPPLLLLDEPFAALDGAVRESLQKDLADLQRELGLSVIYITHNLMDAFALGDRLAVIQAGQLQQVGPIQEVFHHPNSRSVAQITGVRNLLEGKVRSASAEGLTIDWQGRTILAPPAPRLPGESVTFYIRPEDVKLLYPDRPLTSTVQHNRFVGRVVRVTPAGTWVIVHLGLEPEHPSWANGNVTLESRLPERAYRALQLEVGATVAFSLLRDGIKVLPDERR